MPLTEGVGPTGDMKSVRVGPPVGSSVNIVESVGTENPTSEVRLGFKLKVKTDDRPEVMREVIGNVPFPEVVSLAGGEPRAVPLTGGVGDGPP